MDRGGKQPPRVLAENVPTPGSRSLPAGQNLRAENYFLLDTFGLIAGPAMVAAPLPSRDPRRGFFFSQTGEAAFLSAIALAKEERRDSALLRPNALRSTRATHDFVPQLVR